MQEAYREKPKDIKYKETIPIRVLVYGILKDHWIRLSKIPSRVFSFLWNKLYWIFSICIFSPYKIIKSMTYDMVVWLYDLCMCFIEISLNKQRLKMKDPGGEVKLFSKKYKKKYEENNIDFKCFMTGVYLVLTNVCITYLICEYEFSIHGEFTTLSFLSMFIMLVLIVFELRAIIPYFYKVDKKIRGVVKCCECNDYFKKSLTKSSYCGSCYYGRRRSHHNYDYE